MSSNDAAHIDAAQSNRDEGRTVVFLWSFCTFSAQTFAITFQPTENLIIIRINRLWLVFLIGTVSFWLSRSFAPFAMACLPSTFRLISASITHNTQHTHSRITLTMVQPNKHKYTRAQQTFQLPLDKYLLILGTRFSVLHFACQSVRRTRARSNRLRRESVRANQS